MRRGDCFAGHEFHYSNLDQDSAADTLFEASDSRSTETRAVGCRTGNVMGSYLHIVDRAVPS